MLLSPCLGAGYACGFTLFLSDRSVPMLSTDERVREIITRLGNFDDEFALAEFFKQRHHFGLKSHPALCVLADYIRLQTGIRCQVGSTKTRVGDTLIDNPPVVCNFLKLYDEGCFPILETAVFVRECAAMAGLPIRV